MLTVLSPAKRLDFEASTRSLPVTNPALSDQTAGLMKVSKRLKARDLQKLMGISESLADLNHDRFQAMTAEPSSERSKAAVLAFKGDVYLGLDAESLTDDDLLWAQGRMGILSGLYGILRPLDLIQPYRLEMGTRLKTRRGPTLYSYWGPRVTDEVQTRIADHVHPVVVNLASQEYFKVLKGGKLRAQVITPVFKEFHKGKLKVISFNAKRARGLMARWIVQNRIDRPARLPEFDLERFTFREDLSDSLEFVFTRGFVPVGGPAVAP